MKARKDFPELGVVHVSATYGMKPIEQTACKWILTWLNTEHCSFPSLAELARACGTTPATIKSTLSALVAAGFLRHNEGQAMEYTFNKAYTPPIKGKPGKHAKKPGAKFPDWVFTAKSIWEQRGAIPNLTTFYVCLKEVVDIHGEDAMLRGLENYATSETFKGASPRLFVNNCVTWMGRREPVITGEEW